MRELENFVQLKSYVEISKGTFEVLDNSFREYMEVNKDNATFNDQRALITLNEIRLELCRLEEIEGEHTGLRLRKDFFEWLLDRYMQLNILQGKEEAELKVSYKVVKQKRKVALYYDKKDDGGIGFYQCEDDPVTLPCGLYSF